MKESRENEEGRKSKGWACREERGSGQGATGLARLLSAAESWRGFGALSRDRTHDSQSLRILLLLVS